MLTGQRLCHSESHNDTVLAALNQQRSDGILCDVTLIAEEQKFHAHKAVLAACSDYFRVSKGGRVCLRTAMQQYFLTFPGPGAISKVLCRAVSVENLCSFLDRLVSWACWDTHQTGLGARHGKQSSPLHLTNAGGILRALNGAAVTCGA